MPCMKFLFVRSDVCRQLPSDSTSRWAPLLLAIQFPLLGLARDFHPLDNAHAERTENTISRWENGKMGKWENGKNVEQQYRKPTDAGKRVLKRQKPMVYGLQNTHIGMKTDRVIIEEQRKVMVKKQLVADDKYTAFFCHFSSLHTNILSKPTFSITLHLFSPTCSNTPERQHLSILAFWQTDKARETRIKENDVIDNIC